MTSRNRQLNAFSKFLQRYGYGAALCILAGCSTAPPNGKPGIAGYWPDRDGAPSHIPPNLDAVPDAVPRHEARTRAGNPDSYDVLGQHYVLLKDSRGYVARGVASWYGSKFHGAKTSNGEKYDMYAMTAAHKTLPIPCYARITNLENGRAVTVRINDRGPFVDDRIVDLSYTAAYKLGILGKGTGYVELRTVEAGEPLPRVYTAANEPRRLPQPRPQAQSSAAGGNAAERIFVQVGAFSDPANARKLEEELAARQLAQLHVRPVAHQGGWLYRVQLGPVAGIDQANQLAIRLGEIGITGTRFVIEKNNLN
jgi:rare lipoprotein A